MQKILNRDKFIYIQIKEKLEQDILQNILLEGGSVPSSNELAVQYGISPATAAKGVNLLVEEGLLYKTRGIGMIVAIGAKEKIIRKRRNLFFDDYVKRLCIEAVNLQITNEELIEMILYEKKIE